MKISDNSKTDRIGVQIVGEQFELSGYIFREQSISDYGIDAQVELVDGDNVTGKLIALQIKSGDSWFKEESEEAYVFRGDKKHLEYWLDHSLPVLIVLCDTKSRQCFWQSITPANVIYTLKAWKISIPKYQRINAGMNIDLKRLISKFSAYKSYTIGSISDNSHGMAKRYSLRIILNKEHTQAEIIDLIKHITSEAVNYEYHRSDITRSHWRNQAAHIIWLYVYPSAEDEQNNNFICQTEWFSENLQQEYLPISNGGEEISPNLKVCWNNKYLEMAKFNVQYTISKEEFIQKVISVTSMIKPLITLASETLENYVSKKISFNKLEFLLTNKYDKIDKYYKLGTDVGLSPYECKEASIKFQSLIAHAHNIYLPFSGIGKSVEEPQTIFNIRSQLKYFNEVLTEFDFELKKVQ